MRHHLQLAGLCLVALTMNGRAAAADAAIEASGTPAGFGELDQARETLVDVYFGGRKVGEALAETRPGSLRFKAPDKLLANLGDVAATPELVAALAGELPVNASLACSKSNAGNCGLLSPELVGIIYDEDRFRVDIFVNPRFVRTLRPTPGGYLPVPSAPASLTSALGLAAAGTLGGRSTYNVQNRTVIGFRNARIRTSNSLASGLGWVVDDMVAEVDRRDMRYSAGLFWAPGNDFTGQRRIAGAGFSTQFDTSVDRDNLEGTPLLLFLARPARVELLVDGRLVGSKSYPAGNNELDTSSLPDGSYPVLLRVQEESGGVREERRFFVKNARVAPLGHPIVYAFGGFLANTRAHRPVSLGGDFYYQAGAALRLDRSIALDLSAIGTQHKAVVEAGGWLMTGFARLRLAGLASSEGDKGALVQVASAGRGMINFNLDLRRIWSSDGQPLIPLPSYVDTFDGVPPTGTALASGSYTQAIGSVGLRLGDGYVSLVGTYRKDRHLKSDYSIGPSVNWPLVIRNGLSVVLEASAQRTRTTTAGFAGVRMLFSRGGLSMSSLAGRSIEDDRAAPGGAVSRATASLNAQYSAETDGGSLLTGEFGTDRSIRSSSVHAGGTMTSPVGNARLDLVHNFEGGRSTQYDLGFQSGLALSPGSVTLGARQTDQSAIVVSVDGDAAGAGFRVLVDDMPRGEVRVGERLPLFVPAYRTYHVRLLPIDAAAVEFDSGSREVTLYPGNVQSLEWKAESYFTLVAQAVSASGAPIADALVQTRRNVAETDEHGYFQIDLRHGEPVRIARDGGGTCTVRLPELVVRQDFASVGKVSCE